MKSIEPTPEQVEAAKYIDENFVWMGNECVVVDIGKLAAFLAARDAEHERAVAEFRKELEAEKRGGDASCGMANDTAKIWKERAERDEADSLENVRKAKINWDRAEKAEAALVAMTNERDTFKADADEYWEDLKALRAPASDEEVRQAIRYFGNFRSVDGHGDTLVSALRSTKAALRDAEAKIVDLQNCSETIKNLVPLVMWKVQKERAEAAEAKIETLKDAVAKLAALEKK